MMPYITQIFNIKQAFMRNKKDKHHYGVNRIQFEENKLQRKEEQRGTKKD
jgi:hypothetical protein